MGTLDYEVDGASRASRSTAPSAATGSRASAGELAACVERADLDPAVHVILLSGRGKGFCGGYDLVDSAEGMSEAASRPRPRARPSTPR